MLYIDRSPASNRSAGLPFFRTLHIQTHQLAKSQAAFTIFLRLNGLPATKSQGERQHHAAPTITNH
jgi:hypothetical protein